VHQVDGDADVQRNTSFQQVAENEWAAAAAAEQRRRNAEAEQRQRAAEAEAEAEQRRQNAEAEQQQQRANREVERLAGKSAQSIGVAASALPVEQQAAFLRGVRQRWLDARRSKIAEEVNGLHAHRQAPTDEALLREWLPVYRPLATDAAVERWKGRLKACDRLLQFGSVERPWPEGFAAEDEFRQALVSLKEDARALFDLALKLGPGSDAGLACLDDQESIVVIFDRYELEKLRNACDRLRKKVAAVIREWDFRLRVMDPWRMDTRKASESAGGAHSKSGEPMRTKLEWEELEALHVALLGRLSAKIQDAARQAREKWGDKTRTQIMTEPVTVPSKPEEGHPLVAILADEPEAREQLGISGKKWYHVVRVSPDFQGQIVKGDTPTDSLAAAFDSLLKQPLGFAERPGMAPETVAWRIPYAMPKEKPAKLTKSPGELSHWLMSFWMIGSAVRFPQQILGIALGFFGIFAVLGISNLAKVAMKVQDVDHYDTWNYLLIAAAYVGAASFLVAYAHVDWFKWHKCSVDRRRGWAWASIAWAVFCGSCVLVAWMVRTPRIAPLKVTDNTVSVDPDHVGGFWTGYDMLLPYEKFSESSAGKNNKYGVPGSLAVLRPYYAKVVARKTQEKNGTQLTDTDFKDENTVKITYDAAAGSLKVDGYAVDKSIPRVDWHLFVGMVGMLSLLSLGSFVAMHSRFRERDHFARTIAVGALERKLIYDREDLKKRLDAAIAQKATRLRQQREQAVLRSEAESARAKRESQESSWLLEDDETVRVERIKFEARSTCLQALQKAFDGQAEAKWGQP
jgi:hypothetical protein